MRGICAVINFSQIIQFFYFSFRLPVAITMVWSMKMMKHWKTMIWINDQVIKKKIAFQKANTREPTKTL